MRKKKMMPVKCLSGEVKVPGDKSISHRAIMLGAIARGTTVVKGVLDSEDSRATIHAFSSMGINIERNADYTVIVGKGLRGLKRPRKPISAGESGTTMRLLAGIMAGQNFSATLTAAKSLKKRPMKRVVEPLTLMGANVKAKRGDFPPLKIKGGDLKAIDYTMKVASAQVKSAILLAGLYADGRTSIHEKLRSRDHTERMLKYFGARVGIGGQKVSVDGGSELTARSFEIPGDISSAAFFIAAAAITKGSCLRIKKVSINPTRTGIMDVLSRMGGRIDIKDVQNFFEPYADIEVRSSVLHGINIDGASVPGMIDELPVIFVLAACAKGRTVIRGVEELRAKETDRIRSMKYNLGRMGVNLSVKGGTITIDGARQLKGARVKSFGDHRTCMATAVAALAAKGATTIDDVSCVAKSFPKFFDTMEAVSC